MGAEDKDSSNCPEEDPEYQQGAMTDDNSLDPSEFEEDEHFVDEDDANFDVVDVRDRRRFTRRHKLIAAALMLGLAVALAVVFSGGKDTSAAATSTTPTVALEEPPENLENICSFQALADNGKEACMEDCERSECCDFPANLPLSCLEGNQQKCLVYHAACSHLDAESSDLLFLPLYLQRLPTWVSYVRRIVSRLSMALRVVTKLASTPSAVMKKTWEPVRTTNAPDTLRVSLWPPQIMCTRTFLSSSIKSARRTVLFPWRDVPNAVRHAPMLSVAFRQTSKQHPAFNKILHFAVSTLFATIWSPSSPSKPRLQKFSSLVKTVKMRQDTFHSVS